MMYNGRSCTSEESSYKNKCVSLSKNSSPLMKIQREFGPERLIGNIHESPKEKEQERQDSEPQFGSAPCWPKLRGKEKADHNC